jgi:methionyl-tRNA synthetase
VFAHGWWTKDGEKMSKSVGNVLDPNALIAQYGLDYVRYFLAAEVPFGQDGDFSHEAFSMRINSDLANDVGNLAQRCLTMVAKNCDGCIPAPGPLSPDDESMLSAATEALSAARKQMDVQNVKGMCESVINIAKMGNKYIDTQAPWNLRKTDTERFHTVLYVLGESVRRIAVLLEPLTPQSSAVLLDQLGVGRELRTFASLSARIVPGTRIGEVKPVFPRIEKPDKESAAMTAETPVAVPAATYKGALVSTLDQAATQEAIEETGARIRTMKAAKASKDDVSAAVAELNALKQHWQQLTGSLWAAPAKPPA